MNICHCDWFNKEADWPIAGQDKVGGEPNRMLGSKKEKSEGVASRSRERQDEFAILQKGTKPHDKA